MRDAKLLVEDCNDYLDMIGADSDVIEEGKKALYNDEDEKEVEDSEEDEVEDEKEEKKVKLEHETTLSGTAEIKRSTEIIC
jgi:hypothetical protein